VIHATADGVMLDIRVVPRAGRAGIAGTRNGALLVRLNAPPVDGVVNAELVTVMAAVLGVPRKAITIVAGERSRFKRVRIDGATVDDVTAKLGGP
jgi:uncharacterized protein